MPDYGDYFTGGQFPQLIELLEQNMDKNPWKVLAYLSAWRHDDKNYVPPQGDFLQRMRQKIVLKKSRDCSS